MSVISAIWRLARGQFAMIPAELNPRATGASNNTRLDRYPGLFQAAATALPRARQVLSFGCSTGEECATLSGYFPNAHIVGADINVANLAIARRRFNSPQIEFVNSEDRRLTLLAPFDAIFCMAVLRIPHGYKKEFRARVIARYPFARFEGECPDRC
ncbi:MAG: class I SAM-dependent methyltransferase [Methyloceanibacter sp.]